MQEKARHVWNLTAAPSRDLGVVGLLLLFGGLASCSPPADDDTDTPDILVGDAKPVDAAECAEATDCAQPSGPCLVAVCEGGFCATNIIDNGTPCDDGNTCSTGDVCDDGACVGSGACQCAKTSDCIPFDDRNFCNGVLFCDLATRVCKVDPSTRVACPKPSSPCTASTCDTKTGACKSAAANDGQTCVDGDACTEKDVCGSGTCAGVALSKPCDDGNACTDDACDPAKGCVGLPMKATCDDNDACTDDTCAPATGCVNLPMKATCDDNDACTDDTCEPAKGCLNLPVAGTCT